MNSYDLSRMFWDWAFDNPEKISPNHVAIFFFAVEHCNRLGWKDKFGFPSQMTMDAIGIKKHSTYIRYFDDLVEFGFFKLIQKSRNQYSSNIISLTCAMPKNGKALGKAISKHGEKQTESIGLGMGISTGSIDKQILNQEQYIPIKQDQPKKNVFPFLQELVKSGVPKNLAEEWIQVRKAKRLTNTKTAFNKVVSESKLANKPLSEVIRICVERSWGGFNHTWNVDDKETEAPTETTQEPKNINNPHNLSF